MSETRRPLTGQGLNRSGNFLVFALDSREWLQSIIYFLWRDSQEFRRVVWVDTLRRSLQRLSCIHWWNTSAQSCSTKLWSIFDKIKWGKNMRWFPSQGKKSDSSTVVSTPAQVIGRNPVVELEKQKELKHNCLGATMFFRLVGGNSSFVIGS